MLHFKALIRNLLDFKSTQSIKIFIYTSVTGHYHRKFSMFNTMLANVHVKCIKINLLLENISFST
jgi:hypothetical protein